MQNNFNIFLEHSDEIRFINKEFDQIIQKYHFFLISTQLINEQYEEACKCMKKSKIIIIGQYKELNQEPSSQFFIVSFEKMIIIIKQNQISILHSLFSINPELKICFLSNAKEDFDKCIKINYNESFCHNEFEEEVENFNLSFLIKIPKNNIVKKMWRIICQFISSYLIKKSYIKLNKNRIKKFVFKNNKKNSMKILDEDEFIPLRTIGVGSLFIVELIYYIKGEEILALKKPFTNDEETQKLIEREMKNYSQLSHPFLPKFIGKTKENEFLLTEFINGKTLTNIKKLNLKDNDKLKIIFELMLIIDFLHFNHFIYRDLKPNNLMIDENKTVILIDFDRMVSYDYATNNELHTAEFWSCFSAPELNHDDQSYSCDIYSLGMMIYYIINEKIPNQNKSNKSDLFKNFPEMNEYYKKCTKINPSERPLISELLQDFYKNHLEKIANEEYFHIFIDFKEDNKTNLNNKQEISKEMIKKYLMLSIQNDPKAQFNLGSIYEHGVHVQKDINKAIFYFLCSAKQNFHPAQCELGNVFYKGVNIKQDIDKAIHYFTLAADSNDSLAQYALGLIYFSKEFNRQNISKTIHYWNLAADQKYAPALLNLGFIYNEGIYLKRDINKAIFYFTLAANQNLKEAQHNLACIYHQGDIQMRDINKAIYYYTLAANQNYMESQYNLADIYYSGIYIRKDINKAIHYLTLAANQNNSEAQYLLGQIHELDLDAPRDIEKALHYYSLAADQNLAKAQFTMGNIYLTGSYVQQDIKKTIYYYTLAANQNHRAAQYDLGLFYERGEGVQRDINKAIYYYSLAANQNDVNSIFKLGAIYYSRR